MRREISVNNGVGQVVVSHVVEVKEATTVSDGFPTHQAKIYMNCGGISNSDSSFVRRFEMIWAWQEGRVSQCCGCVRLVVLPWNGLLAVVISHLVPHALHPDISHKGQDGCNHPKVLLNA